MRSSASCSNTRRAIVAIVTCCYCFVAPGSGAAASTVPSEGAPSLARDVTEQGQEHPEATARASSGKEVGEQPEAIEYGSASDISSLIRNGWAYDVAQF